MSIRQHPTRRTAIKVMAGALAAAALPGTTKTVAAMPADVDALAKSLIEAALGEYQGFFDVAIGADGSIPLPECWKVADENALAAGGLSWRDCPMIEVFVESNPLYGLGGRYYLKHLGSSYNPLHQPIHGGRLSIGQDLLNTAGISRGAVVFGHQDRIYVAAVEHAQTFATWVDLQKQNDVTNAYRNAKRWLGVRDLDGN